MIISSSRSIITPAACGACEAAAQQAAPPAYVYALGRVEHRFPSVSIEKEYAQAAGRSPQNGRLDGEVLHSVLSKPEHRYLLRKMCWVFTIQGLDTYILQPSEPADLDVLLKAIRPAAHPMDVDAVIGIKGPIAGPELCNGLMIPIVYFDQIYSFDRDTLVKAIPRAEGTDAKTFEASASDLFGKVLHLTDNAGMLDGHRALNYLAMRYPNIYTTVADAQNRNSALTNVEVRPSGVGNTRKIVEVIFTFTNRNNEFTEKSFVRVDVEDEFPFLVSRLAPYYDH